MSLLLSTDLIVELCVCVAIGMLYGLMMARAKQLKKWKEREEKELLRWQIELERKSASLREREKDVRV